MLEASVWPVFLNFRALRITGRYWLPSKDLVSVGVQWGPGMCMFDKVF